MPRTVMPRSGTTRRAPARRTSHESPSDLVIWVYAISRDLSRSQLAGLRGVAGEPVRAITHGTLTAVVGSVDAATYGEEARATLLADLASIERIGRVHHQVVACIAADGPVLPMRLSTVYPDDATVTELLANRCDEFSVTLESFRDMQEWGVKVYADPSDVETPGPLWQDAEGCAQVIDHALSGIAVTSYRHPSQDPRFAGPGDWLMLNGTYLLNSDRAAEFASVVAALTGLHDGARSEITGPWPPYSFAELHDP
ncbi:MAG TPA: GvpL/GvpF family gas vesicle protein [Streptosporangiaceae bacterium]|nr:GvpL/GvpF family gas vesicle protein [Streptosporangiaceae bacterium]